MTCGHAGEEGRFCAQCGTRLRWDCRQPGCNFFNAYPRDKFCPNCGTARPEWVK